MTDLILYTTEDGTSRIQLRAKGQTVWLSQREMAELFAVSSDNIGLHLPLCQAGLIQSLSQASLPGLSACVEVGGIAPVLCLKALLPQPISI